MHIGTLEYRVAYCTRTEALVRGIGIAEGLVGLVGSTTKLNLSPSLSSLPRLSTCRDSWVTNGRFPIFFLNLPRAPH